MAQATTKNTTSAHNVISLCNYRAADIGARKNIIEKGEPAFAAGKFPANDYRRIGGDIATTARLLRAGLVPTETLASWLDRLSISAELASRNVRVFEDRAGQRQLKSTKSKAKRL